MQAADLVKKGEITVARLEEKYRKEIVPALKEKMHYKNNLQIPKLEKIVINMGVGKAMENKQRLESAVQEMGLISGQKPVVTKARNSIAGFKLREGQEIGCKVTMRGSRMYEFLDRLISIAVPRIRDFRGLKKDSFDKFGNYSLGLSEQNIFPEINLDDIEFTQGMDIIMVVKNGSPEASFELLKLFGMPFKA